MAKIVALLVSIFLFFYLFSQDKNQNNITSDVIFILDISHSMNTKDVYDNGIKVSRLELSKSFIKKTMQNNPKTKFGLIIFSKYANYLLPPTADHESYQAYLDRINTNVLPAGGTNLVNGIEKFVKNSNGLGVLISDMGENQDFETQKEKIKKLLKNAKNLLVIGVGSKLPGIVVLPNNEPIQKDGKNVLSSRNDEVGDFFKKEFNIGYYNLESNNDFENIKILWKNSIISDKTSKMLWSIATLLGILGIL